jgi:WhiB family redox-sensing transcriptional regulator
VVNSLDANRPTGCLPWCFGGSQREQGACRPASPALASALAETSGTSLGPFGIGGEEMLVDGSRKAVPFQSPSCRQMSKVRRLMSRLARDDSLTMGMQIRTTSNRISRRGEWGARGVPDLPSGAPLRTRFLGAKTDRKGADVLDTNWMAEGKCRDHSPRTFFPSDGVGVEIAKRVCGVCPVREECLEYALFHRIEHGVWGGASERARRRIVRQRRSLQLTSV